MKGPCGKKYDNLLLQVTSCAAVVVRAGPLYMSYIIKNLSAMFLTRSNTNWAVQPQKMARGLKFRIKEVE